MIFCKKNYVLLALKQIGRIKDFVPNRVYPPTLPKLVTPFFLQYIHDHRTHPPIACLGIFAIKSLLFNINPPKIEKLKLEK